MYERDLLNSSRSIFLDIKGQIRALDKSISGAIVVDISVAILVIMVQIYALAQNSPIIRQYATIIGFNAISEIIRLIINCWVNGLVYEQTDKIMTILDEINPNDLDAHMYRQWMAFKTISRDISFGFTVGGLGTTQENHISIGETHK